VREAGIDNFYDRAGHLPHRAARARAPAAGMFAVGGDSHCRPAGPLPLHVRIGATEMAGVLVTGEIWLKVPHTIAMDSRAASAPA